MIRIPTLEVCRILLFPFIRREMADAEPAPYYEGERSGLEHIEGIFALMEREEYEGILGKAAYMFCSVIDGHHFSNGNKRLGVALLTYMLLVNDCRISAPDLRIMREELERAFPYLQWEDVASFRHAHEYFFYHLALIIADRQQKGTMTFQQEQAAVRELLKVVTV